MMYLKKAFILIILCIISIIALTGCQSDDAQNKGLSKEIKSKTGSTFLMDTLIQMKVYGPQAEIVIDDSFERIKEIENEMSKTIKTSDVYRINEDAGEFVKVKKDTFKVIKKALYYARLTKGHFDPSIGPVVQLWGIGTEDARIPADKEIKDALDFVDYRQIEINEEKLEVKLVKKGMQLDLGAIAKGYAADEVRKIANEYQVKHAYVNLGGNVLVIGGKPDGSPWRVGIQDPRINRGRGSVMASIAVKDKTIVTSGNYERYFKEDGIIYHHILNPFTGRPARKRVISVSIVAKDSFDADALSTSAFILGLEEGKKLIEEIPETEAMFITKDLKVYLTSGLREKVELLSDDFILAGSE